MDDETQVSMPLQCPQLVQVFCARQWLDFKNSAGSEEAGQVLT